MDKIGENHFTDPSRPVRQVGQVGSTPSKPSLKGGFGRVLLQNQINQRCHVAHVDFAVAVDVAHGVGIGAAAEDFVNQGGNIAHIHFAVAIDVACDLRVEVNINMSNTAGLEAR